VRASSWQSTLSLLLLCVGSTFPEGKAEFEGLDLPNGAVELKRPVRSHCHRHASHGEESGDKLQARNKLIIASGVCLVFMIGEVIEVLGAFISVVSIWAVTGVLVFLAVERIVRNDYDINGHVMLVTSGCAVLVNIICSSGHSHTLLSGHSNTSVRAAFIHVLGDLLQSVGVMVAAIVIFFRPEYKVADPICTFLFSAFVLCTTITILRDVFRILMEGSPKDIQYNSVKEVLQSVKAVKSVLVSVHLAIGADSQSVLSEATDLLHNKFGFYSITVQVETFTDDMSHCCLCQDPQD
uniref:Probable proton-coupled zinc antiporter SLC30A3 n=1 Tax=Neogobius melanostomus TaxID=47308 RepID=A0A8C6TSW6_9GOBI